MATAPPPPSAGAAPPPFGGNRCGWCGGSLYATEATGRPQPEDHETGCKFFDTAVQVMQYVVELEQASAGSGGRYLRKSIKQLSAAACAGDPVRAITILARKYDTDAKKSTKRAEAAEILSQACQALTQGKKPAPITLAPK
jgi:hypothetical protein